MNALCIKISTSFSCVCHFLAHLGAITCVLFVLGGSLGKQYIDLYFHEDISSIKMFSAFFFDICLLLSLFLISEDYLR